MTQPFAIAPQRPMIKFDTKLFPTFDGTTPIRSWILQVRDATRLITTDETTLRNLALFALRGPARDFMARHEHKLTNIEQILNLLADKYAGAKEQMILRSKLADLKQTNIGEYNRTFDTLIQQVSSMDHLDKLRFYLNGLKPALRNALIMVDTDDLDTYMRLAEQFEEANKRPSWHPNTTTNYPTSSTTNSTKKLSKLTPEEKEVCILKKLCFRCRLPGHSSRTCPKGQVHQGQA